MLSAGQTRTYTLTSGETVAQVAKRYHLSLAQLKKINQFRTFAHPFEQQRAGDEIEVPVQGTADGTPAAGNLTNAQAQTAAVTRWLSGSAASLAQATSGPHHSEMNNAVSSQARSMAASGGETAVNQWLNQFGTARFQLGMDDHFSLSDSALDMLVPLYDNGKSILFTQFGGRHRDGRNTLNVGSGVRLFIGSWMYGSNVFLDNDITGHNRRVGIGAEAWTDYLKLSANTYFGMNSWHQSRDFSDYDEKPADGFDLTAEGWLPAYPQIGSTLKYEQYQGNNVALMDKDTLQKNPKAMTVGLNWTPVPLVTLGTDYRKSGGEDELQLEAQFSWRFGDSLQSQLSGDSVAASRTLAGSRLDLVERNNNIVLDYRKQDILRLSLPDSLHGPSQSVQVLKASVNSKYGLANVDWSAPELVAAGGRITAQGADTLQIQLPDWQAGMANKYVIHAQAIDTHGNLSTPAETTLSLDVQTVDSKQSGIEQLNGLSTLPANGQKSLTLSLRDANGHPVTGMASAITLPFVFTPQTGVMNRSSRDALRSRSLSSKATVGVTLSPVSEVSPGDYEFTLSTGSVPGTIVISPHVNGVALQQFNVTVASPDNTAPVVTGVTVSGTPVVGATLTGSYAYSDADNDAEGASLFQWYRDGAPISGATQKTYSPVTADESHSLTFGVTPVATTGVSKGTEVKSSPVLVTVSTQLETLPDITVPVGQTGPVGHVVPSVHGGTVTYKSSDSSKVSVDASTGLLDIKAATDGTPVIITATVKATGYPDLIVSYKVTVLPADPVFISETESTLTSETKTPKAGSQVTVRLKLKGTDGKALAGKTGITLLITHLGGTPSGGTASFNEDGSHAGQYTASFTPAMEGTYLLAAQYQKSGEPSFNKELDLTVGAASPLEATVGVHSKTVDVGNTITPFKPVTAAGGTGSLNYSVTPHLPAGLSMNGTTGEISGTPTTPSAATDYTVTVTDSAPTPNKVTGKFNLTVSAEAETLPDITVPVGQTGPVGHVVPSVHGGTVAYKSSDSSKVSVDASTGLLDIKAATDGTPVIITATVKATGYPDLIVSYKVTVLPADPVFISETESTLTSETKTPKAGSQVTVRLKLKGTDGKALAGKTGIVLQIMHLGGTPSAETASFNEDGSHAGQYTASFTPAMEGTYLLAAQYKNTGEPSFNKELNLTVGAHK